MGNLSDIHSFQQPSMYTYSFARHWTTLYIKLPNARVKGNFARSQKQIGTALCHMLLSSTMSLCMTRLGVAASQTSHTALELLMRRQTIKEIKRGPRSYL